MDLSCIISSGDLELYVLGMLPEEEAYKISQLELLFEEVAIEIDRIRETLHLIADEAEMEPSPVVRENFIAAIKQLKQQDDEPVVLINTEEPQATAKVVTMGERRGNKQWMLAASIILLVACIGCIVYLFNKNEKYQQQMATIQSQVDSSKKQADDYAQVLKMLQDPSTLQLKLTSLPGKPQALAQVFWNKDTHQVMVSDVTLPAVPQGKQYQLWAIVKGKPVDAGMIGYEKQRLQKMKDLQDAEAFAITLEKEGGSPSPTMAEMYVMSPVS